MSKKREFLIWLVSVLIVVLFCGCGEKQKMGEATDLGTFSQVSETASQENIADDVDDTEEIEQGEEKQWNDKTVFACPKRASLAEGLEILDVKECLSDFSLLITLENLGDEDFLFSLDYALDVKIDGEWYEYVPMDSLDSTQLTYALASGKSKTMAYELWKYADLPEGEYRITTKEGISGQFVIDEDEEYALHAVEVFPERTADEIYQSMTEICSEYDYDFSRSYVFENRGFHGVFYIQFMEDHRYCYEEGSGCSYVGSGRFEINENELVMIDDGGLENHFRIEKNELIYEAGNSSGFTYARVSDGDKFICERGLWEEVNQGNPEQKLVYYVAE